MRNADWEKKTKYTLMNKIHFFFLFFPAFKYCRRQTEKSSNDFFNVLFYSKCFYAHSKLHGYIIDCVLLVLYSNRFFVQSVGIGRLESKIMNSFFLLALYKKFVSCCRRNVCCFCYFQNSLLV